MIFLVFYLKKLINLYLYSIYLIYIFYLFYAYLFIYVKNKFNYFVSKYFKS